MKKIKYLVLIMMMLFVSLPIVKALDSIYIDRNKPFYNIAINDPWLPLSENEFFNVDGEVESLRDFLTFDPKANLITLAKDASFQSFSYYAGNVNDYYPLDEATRPENDTPTIVLNGEHKFTGLTFFTTYEEPTKRMAKIKITGEGTFSAPLIVSATGIATRDVHLSTIEVEDWLENNVITDLNKYTFPFKGVTNITDDGSYQIKDYKGIVVSSSKLSQEDLDKYTEEWTRYFTKIEVLKDNMDLIVRDSDSNFLASYSLESKDLTNTLSDEDKKSIAGDKKEILALYDISVHDENGELLKLEDGNYYIRIKLTEEMKKFPYYQAVYVEDGKVVETFKVRIVDDYLEFYTTHLSEYGILGMDEEPYIKGDLNGNMKIEVADAIEALKYYVELNTLNEKAITIADFNNNNKIDVSDAVEILKLYINK